MYKIRPRVSHPPANGSSLTVCDQDRWTDSFQKLHASDSVVQLRQSSVALGLNLRGIECIKGRVPSDAGTRPLGMEDRLRPMLISLRGSKVSLRIFDRRVIQVPVSFDVRRASSLGLINDVNDISRR